MPNCAACGSPAAHKSIGGTLLCRDCTPRIEETISALHAEGKTVNAQKIARELFREEHSAGNYLLRDIPSDLWTKAKHRAVDEGISLRELLLKSLREYIA